jgi:Cdc6-like AAA superfamily ATPase
MRDVDGQPHTNPICIVEIETTAPVDSENKRPLKFHLNAETLTTPHTLITAKDGEGKTHTARTIAKELADKTQHAIVIMDPYNEYAETVKNPDKPIQIVAPNTDKTAKDASRNVRPNQTTILLAGGLTLKEKRDLYNQHLTMLWKARLEKTAPPFLLIAEDAESLKGETLDEIAYAGTKNGATLLLIAKHPTELGGNILSQTTTQITGRTTDKDDLNYLSNVVGEKTALLPKLKRGQWIISSASTIKPFQIETTET